jgi:hypothetical protein
MATCGHVTRKGTLCKNRVPNEGSACHYHSRPVCPICLDYICPNQELRTSCNHRFHFECLAQWVVQSPWCPLCRAALNGLVLAPSDFRYLGPVSYMKPRTTRRSFVVNGNTLKPDLTYSEGWLWDEFMDTGVLPVYPVMSGAIVDTFTRAHAIWTEGDPICLHLRPSSRLKGIMETLYSTENTFYGCTRYNWEITTRWGSSVLACFRRRYPSPWNTLMADMFAYLLQHLRPAPTNLYQHMIVAAVYAILTRFDEREDLWPRVRFYFANSENEENTALNIRNALNTNAFFK